MPKWVVHFAVDSSTVLLWMVSSGNFPRVRWFIIGNWDISKSFYLLATDFPPPSLFPSLASQVFAESLCAPGTTLGLECRNEESVTLNKRLVHKGSGPVNTEKQMGQIHWEGLTQRHWTQPGDCPGHRARCKQGRGGGQERHLRRIGWFSALFFYNQLKCSHKQQLPSTIGVHWGCTTLLSHLGGFCRKGVQTKLGRKEYGGGMSFS